MSDPTDNTVALSEMQPGQKGKVVAIQLQGVARQRILEMGLTIGVDIEVIRFAPLGDPMEIRVRSYALSLRKAEAADIRIAHI